MSITSSMSARILILGRLPLHGCAGLTVLPTRAIRRQLARTLRQSGQFRGSLQPARKVTSSAQTTSRALSTAPKQPDDSGEPIAGPSQPKGVEPGNEEELRESPYTLPNALTLARILACPVLGYTIVQEQFAWATGLLFACGVSDWLDGWIARRWKSKSVLGSILDPAADKFLMTTLVGTLAWSGQLPVPLAVLIFGRDFALSISAFYFRFISLPKPRTLKRYFDPSMPSAEVKPTQISKVNTALQLVLMGVTTINPLLGVDLSLPLKALQWTVAGTTIWSGFSYIGRAGVRILPRPTKKP